jgi:hypothetical protein
MRPPSSRIVTSNTWTGKSRSKERLSRMRVLARAASSRSPISSIVSNASSGVITSDAGYQSRAPRLRGSSWSCPHA